VSTGRERDMPCGCCQRKKKKEKRKKEKRKKCFRVRESDFSSF